MPMKDFYEYIAYSRLEPFGDERADMRAALVPWYLSGLVSKDGKTEELGTYMISEMLRDSATGGKTRRPRPAQTSTQMVNVLKMHYGNNR